MLAGVCNDQKMKEKPSSSCMNVTKILIGKVLPDEPTAMLGYTLAYVMRITWQVIKITSCIAALCICGAGRLAVGADWEKTPRRVQTKNGSIIGIERNAVFIKANDQSAKRPLDVSRLLRGAIALASNVAFPESATRIIDGKEYLLIVVSLYSRANPGGGQCGAGEESTLYVLQIDDSAGIERFNELVDSCLKSISLHAPDYRSPFSAIAWREKEEGFDVIGGSDAVGGTTRHYRMRDGAFVVTP